MSAYLGIRYAEPPFGPLRLQPPVDCDGEPTGAFGDAHNFERQDTLEHLMRLNCDRWRHVVSLPGAAFWRPPVRQFFYRFFSMRINCGSPEIT